MNRLLWMMSLLVVTFNSLPRQAGGAENRDVMHIGSRLELMVDEHLIERMSGGAHLQLHKPSMREVAIVTDKPWEGNGCTYWSIFKDGDVYRAYYGGLHYDTVPEKFSAPHRSLLCYAESRDGIRWSKPDLGLFEFDGSKHNNIVLDDVFQVEGISPDHVAVFKDTRPNCPAEARYKAVVRAKDPVGLVVFHSSDAIHFTPAGERRIITEGAFDSLNLAFWDSTRGEYRAYFRGFRDGVRDILTTTSSDFEHWSDPVWLEYPAAPREHLYTNQVRPYYRAPHIFIGFPMRYVDRGWTAQAKALPGLEERERRARQSLRYGSAVTDGLFMTSRDGTTFNRWGEAIIRPGLRPSDNWVYGDNCTAWGLVETKSSVDGAPNELSIYATESYWTGKSMRMRRYTYRIDGFVSARAPLGGGELITKPITFEGDKLSVNFSTSAAGSLRVEIQDATGRPVEGFALADSPEIFGDELHRTVTWNAGDDVSRLAGKAVKLRIVLKDADLFAFRFHR